MAKEIAVFLKEDGKTISIYDPGKIVVYGKTQGKWAILREQDLCIDKSQGLAELRQKVSEVITFLNECKTFVAISVVGVPYYELIKAGCSVWEFEGAPEEFLDYILEQEEEALTQSSGQTSFNKFSPIETGNGCYEISLKEVQADNTGITSKQVLLPFLRKGAFYSLEVVCSHVPPWLEVEFISGNYNGDIEKVGNEEIRILITKKCCSGKDAS